LGLNHDTEVKRTRDDAGLWVKEAAAVTCNPALNISARRSAKYGLFQKHNLLFDDPDHFAIVIVDSYENGNLNGKADQFFGNLFAVINRPARDFTAANIPLVNLAVGVLKQIVILFFVMPIVFVVLRHGRKSGLEDTLNSVLLEAENLTMQFNGLTTQSHFHMIQALCTASRRTHTPLKVECLGLSGLRVPLFKHLRLFTIANSCKRLRPMEPSLPVAVSFLRPVSADANAAAAGSGKPTGTPVGCFSLPSLCLLEIDAVRHVDLVGRAVGDRSAVPKCHRVDDLIFFTHPSEEQENLPALWWDCVCVAHTRPRFRRWRDFTRDSPSY
jgi:hypothetical protein